MISSTFLLYKESVLTEIKRDINLLGKQYFMTVHGHLLEFTGLKLLKFYLLKHPANVYQLVLEN